MGTQNTSKTPYIITIFILLAVIIGGGVYLIFFAGNRTEEKHIPSPERANIDDDTDAEKYTKDTLLGKLECVKDQKPGADYCKIDSAKILNSKAGVTYTWTENDADFNKLASIEIDKDDAHKATIKFDQILVEKYYGEKGLNFPIYLTFSREIDSYKIAGFGQAVGDEYIFFVLKDGNVGMVSVYSMLKDKKYDPVMVKGVKDIIAIQGGSSYNDYFGNHTNFAITKNQTAYDLQTLLPSWGTTTEQ
jgi:hypothetical protein